MIFELLNNGSIFSGNRMDLIYSYGFQGTETMDRPSTDPKTSRIELDCFGSSTFGPKAVSHSANDVRSLR